MDQSITLVRKLLSAAVLATCHRIYYEAIQFFELRLRELEIEPVLFVLGYGGAVALTHEKIVH
jgi:hypothetical protein